MGKYQTGICIHQRLYVAILEGKEVTDLCEKQMESPLVPVLLASDNYDLLGPDLGTDPAPVQILYIKPLSVDEVLNVNLV